MREARPLRDTEPAAPADTFRIATPTTGFAPLMPRGVYATYRFSAHQAIVPAEIYEPSMAALFRKLHGSATAEDEAWVRSLVDVELHKEPRDVGQGDDDTFFRQHVALECLRSFGTEQDLPLLDPFLRASGFHVQLSAVRALAGIPGEPSQSRLLEFLTGDHPPVAKVLAVWGLRDQDARSLAPALEPLLATMSTEECGLGIKLMDPRIGTAFPESAHEALEELLEGWKAPK